MELELNNSLYTLIIPTVGILVASVLAAVGSDRWVNRKSKV